MYTFKTSSDGRVRGGGALSKSTLFALSSQPGFTLRSNFSADEGVLYQSNQQWNWGYRGKEVCMYQHHGILWPAQWVSCPLSEVYMYYVSSLGNIGQTAVTWQYIRNNFLLKVVRIMIYTTISSQKEKCSRKTVRDDLCLFWSGFTKKKKKTRVKKRKLYLYIQLDPM